MAHHKRRRAKSTRAGCMLCKPHKHQRNAGRAESQTMQERKAREADRQREQGEP